MESESGLLDKLKYRRRAWTTTKNTAAELLKKENFMKIYQRSTIPFSF